MKKGQCCSTRIPENPPSRNGGEADPELSAGPLSGAAHVARRGWALPEHSSPKAVSNTWSRRPRAPGLAEPRILPTARAISSWGHLLTSVRAPPAHGARAAPCAELAAPQQQPTSASSASPERPGLQKKNPRWVTPRSAVSAAPAHSPAFAVLFTLKGPKLLRQKNLVCRGSQCHP